MERFQSIEKLVGQSNWSEWKFDVGLQLNVHKVLGVVTGDTKIPLPLNDDASLQQIKEYEELVKRFKDSDDTAKYIIGSSVKGEAKQHILTCKTAKEMWDALHSVYEQKNERRLDLLYTQLFSYQKESRDDIATHVSKLQRIWQDLHEELKAEGVELPKSMLLNRVLNTLPNEFLEFKNAWESVPTKERTLSVLTERLRLHEQRLVEVGKLESGFRSTALVCPQNKMEHKSDGKSKTYQMVKPVYNKLKDQAKSKPKCYFCGKIGHVKSDCWKLKSHSGRFNHKSFNKQTTTNDDAFLSGNGLMEDELWIIDSGASNHICNNIECFSSYSSFEEKKPLRLGDGRPMFAHGEGNIKVQCLVDGKWIPGHFEKVWYVPGATQNLFSAGSALDKGLTENADSKRREFRRNGNVVAVGVRKRGGLYKLLMKVIKPKDSMCIADKEESLAVWHERLSHQNKRYVENFLRSQGISYKDDFSHCDACMFGKMHRLSFGTRKDRPTQPGDLINADVCGPMPEKSIGGCRFFVDFKDDFSKYRAVYFIKEKREVKEKLKHFLAEVKVAGHTVKQLLTDGGGEFNNSDVHEITKELGLNHRMSMPYTPEQNGVAEQDNRTLVEAARTMLHGAQLPKKLWAEAVNTAAYVINRTGPSSVKSCSPYEVWFGKKPTVTHLRIFGTKCFVHVPKTKRKKFDSKAKVGYLVGYCGDRDGYRIWVPEENNVILSRDVVFKKERTTVDLSETVNEDSLSSSGFEREDIYHKDTKENVTETKSCNEGDSPFQLQETTFESVPQYSGKRNRKPPERFNDYVMMSQIEEPSTFEEAVSCKEHVFWSEAMQEELQSLRENHTWDLVTLPEGRKSIENRWVYRVKTRSDGTVNRFKARLVAKGYSQKYGIDYNETFSPVVRWDTIRTMISYAANKGLKMAQFDVKTAFLHGSLDEEIYMNQPYGFEDGTNRVCLLRKSLYGLKQSPRCWNKTFRTFLESLNLYASEADPCLFISKEKNLFLTLYVDDGLVFATKEKYLNNFVCALKKKFNVTIEEAAYFLGLQIERRECGSIFINQGSYTKRILQKFNMSDAFPVSTPIEKGQWNEVKQEKVLDVPYREAVGSLMFLATVSRPDIAFAVSLLSQHLDSYTDKDWKMVKRVMKYLKGTTEMGILYKPNHDSNNLECFSDADFAGDFETRRSTSGMVFKYSGGAIAWSSRRQRSVALSTTEAEFIASSEATKEIVWLQRLLKEIHESDLNVPVLQIDNASAVKLIHNPEFHQRSKHIDVRYNFVREKVAERTLDVVHIPGNQQVADIFTKPLPTPRFCYLRTLVGVTSDE